MAASPPRFPLFLLRRCRRVAAFVMVSVCLFLGLVRAPAPETESPGVQPVLTESAAALPERLRAPAEVGEERPPVASAVLTARPVM